MGAACSTRSIKPVEKTIQYAVDVDEGARFTTLAELLIGRGTTSADRMAYTFLGDKGEVKQALTYGQLLARARTVAAKLQQAGAQGERVLLLYAPGLDLVAAFFGCQLAGAVAVLTFPPDPTKLRRDLPRLVGVLEDAQCICGLTDSRIRAVLRTQSGPVGRLNWIVAGSKASSAHKAWTSSTPVLPSTLSFFQYSSGSTGEPKGVMLSHANLMDNSQQICDGFGCTTQSKGVIWLPPYHDMGLIGGIIQPMYSCFPCYLMSPFSFLRNPMVWLECISAYGGTISGGPNFAYDLCVRKATDAQLAKLDLSTWSVAFNGAEPIYASTIDSFAAKFAPRGYSPASMYCCYGLAEATLIVCGIDRCDEPTRIAVDRKALQGGKVVIAVDATADGMQTVIGCGRPPVESSSVAIVDAETARRVAVGCTGEIWVSNASVGQGYWRKDEASEETFRAKIVGDADAPPRRWLRTGDAGFIHEGHLYVYSRIKDLIIIRGRNFAPADIERSVGACSPNVRAGCQAALSVHTTSTDASGARIEEEVLVIVSEVRPGLKLSKAEIDAVLFAIRAAVMEQHQLNCYEIVVLQSHQIPKTTSGKIRRFAVRQAYETGALPSVIGTHKLGDKLVVAGQEGRRSPAGAAVAGDAAAAAAVAVKLVPPTAERLGKLDSDSRNAEVRHYVTHRVCELLNLDVAAVDASAPLTQLGMDSMRAVDIKGTLERELAECEVLIPQTLFDVGAGPSVDALVAEACKQVSAALQKLVVPAKSTM